MFNYSSHIAFPGGALNYLEHGDQYNITHNNYSHSDSRPQFAFEDRWKMELYQEYKRVRIGDVKLLQMIGEARVAREEYENHRFTGWEGRNDFRAKRVFSVACVGNILASSVVYTGPDGTKVYCLLYSQTKHANVAQLHAFNESKTNPMILFHDELIPLAHVFQNHPDCRYALTHYITLQDIFISPHIPFNKSWNQVWICPQDGKIVYGPEGPDFDLFMPEIHIDSELYSAHQHPPSGPPLKPSLYNHETLINHLAAQLLEGFIPTRADFKLHYQPLPFDSFFTVLSASSTSPNAIARFPEGEGDASWRLSYSGEHNAYKTVTVDGERIWYAYSQLPHYPSVRLDMDYPYESKLCSSWLAQALHIFTMLDIPQDDWGNYGYIYAAILETITQDTGDSPFIDKDHYIDLDLPCYLFALPCSQFSNDFHCISSWTLGTNIYYWSTDPYGHLKMMEECLAHGLPSNLPKGFDPTTTDYAQSLGYPIFRIVYPGEDQFKEFSDDTGLHSSVSSVESGGKPMEVDSLPGVHNADLLLTGDAVGDMDIEMGDIYSVIVGPIVDRMEVDD
ncbi:hypothetical protein L218DRAFT_1009850 [Marasmius fiardii PR-910]|nr:hypothetical protein L218DRAFT_1009850 [Marasmius fiardii PR-910]